jgi:hypothetical protein
MKWLIVSLLGLVAAAPVSTDEAAQRLRQRQEQRAVEANAPATKAEVAELRKELAELRRDLAELRKLLTPDDGADTAAPAAARSRDDDPPARSDPPVASGPSSSGGGRVSVKGYTRKDGTYVAPHTRAAPGSGRRK